MKIEFRYKQYDSGFATFFSYVMNMLFAILTIIPSAMVFSLPYGIYEAITKKDIESLLIGFALGIAGILLFLLYFKVIRPLIDKIAETIDML